MSLNFNIKIIFKVFDNLLIISSISLNNPLLNKSPIRHLIEPLNTIIPEDLFNKSSKLQCGSVSSELSK